MFLIYEQMFTDQICQYCSNLSILWTYTNTNASGIWSLTGQLIGNHSRLGKPLDVAGPHVCLLPISMHKGCNTSNKRTEKQK